MGQEWAASSPFLFFSDHHGDLGEAIRKGRREEFAAFAAFADPETRDRIPDPQAPSTFARSKLPWAEREHEPHRAVLSLYRELLALRRDDPVLAAPCGWDDLHASTRGNVLEVVRTHGREQRRLLVTFGAEAAPIDAPPDARVIFTCGTHARGKLGARSAVILALTAV
jgi:maltooligosyltrehalose trehalohydrolase